MRLSRRFSREAKLYGIRVHCPCELCRLGFGRMLYPRLGGMPIRFRRIPGFAGNMQLRREVARLRRLP